MKTKISLRNGIIAFVIFFVIVSWIGSEVPVTSGEVTIYDAGDTVQKTLTVSSSREPDTDFYDKDVYYLQGTCVLMKDGEVLSEEKTPMSSKTHQCVLNQRFDSTGDYMFVAGIVSAESHYVNHAWQSYTYSEVAKETFPFSVKEIMPPSVPIWEQIWNNFIAGLQSLIAMFFPS